MSAVPTHPPETNAGITTSWLPMSTAWPSVAGCESSFWKVSPQTLAGWDPGYGIWVQPGLSCQPPQVTSWWDENHSNGIDYSATAYSLGPVVCPDAYFTATTSVNTQSSTFVGCCPSGYSFLDFCAAGDTCECVSNLSPGQVVQFATYDPNVTTSPTWFLSTSTLSTSSIAYGIQVNGWLFPGSDTSGVTGQPTQTGGTSGSGGFNFPTSSLASTTTASGSGGSSGSSSGLSTGAIVGIGVGVPLAVIAAAAMAVAIFFYRRANRADKRVSALAMGQQQGGGGPGDKPPHTAGVQGMPVYYQPTWELPAQEQPTQPHELSGARYVPQVPMGHQQMASQYVPQAPHSP